MLAREGARLDGIYYSPVHPDADGPYRRISACRKPGPDMVLAACEDFPVVPGRSVLIGDGIDDLRAGRAAGVGTVALVRTGHGARHEAAARGMGAAVIADDLNRAVDRLIGLGVIGASPA